MTKRERYWVHSDPGTDSSTNGNGPKCLVCHKPYRDAYLCSKPISDDDPKGGCTEKLETHLGNIPGLADDLEISRTRQSVGAGRNGSRGSEHPLPWDNRATLAEIALRNELVGLVRDLDPKPVIVGGPVCILCKHESCAEFLVSTWPADTPAAMSRWLLSHIGEIRQHLAADEIFRSVRNAVTSVEWVVDRRPDRWYAGQCRAELGPDDDTGKGARSCVVDLYAKPDEAIVKCDECGHGHNAKARKKWLLAYAEDLLETATTIARACTALDNPVTPERIRQWAARGRLVAKGVNGRGHPTYRIGDVLDRLGEDYASAERRSRKAQKTGVLAS